MKIYVASSWRNAYQQRVVAQLRSAGFEAKHGFAWSGIDRDWQNWTPEQFRATFRAALDHPIAVEGYELNMEAMEWADAFVLVHPCGHSPHHSAHLEAGWAAGRGKPVVVAMAGRTEPELMLKLCSAFVELDDSCDAVIQALLRFAPQAGEPDDGPDRDGSGCATSAGGGIVHVPIPRTAAG